MKFFTKEYQRDMSRTDMHLLIRVTKKAEKFDEIYYLDLYKKELQNFLQEQKEICEIMQEDEFDEAHWDEISIMDEDGNLVSVSEFMSQEEVEELRKNILEEERDKSENFEMEEYDELKLTNQFAINHKDAIEFLKNNLPEDILKDVADIRVLALDKASKNIKKRIEKYCKENEKATEKVMKDYFNYFKLIELEIPNKILDNYEFHDCKILSVNKAGNDIVFELDNSGGFTDITKIIYRNGHIIENNLEENSYWIYDEIYKINDFYEFHIGISANNEYDYDYITLRASDVDFEWR